MDNVQIKDVSNNTVEFDVNTPTETAITPEYVNSLVAERDSLKQQLDAEHNNYLRALADTDNIRKNFAKKQADLYEYQYEPIMKDVLDVLDDAERATLSGELSEGAVLIFSKLGTKLYKFGLSRFEIEKGTEFNADEMEAISVIPMGDEMVNKVIDNPTIGYKYNGKIIRYPKVVVGA